MYVVTTYGMTLLKRHSLHLWLQLHIYVLAAVTGVKSAIFNDSFHTICASGFANKGEVMAQSRDKISVRSFLGDIYPFCPFVVQFLLSIEWHLLFHRCCWKRTYWRTCRYHQCNTVKPWQRQSTSLLQKWEWQRQNTKPALPPLSRFEKLQRGFLEVSNF